MYRLEVEMLGLPSLGNTHRNYWKAGSERKIWRNRTKLITMLRRPRSPLTSCRIICTRFSSVEPDEDNLAISFKSCIDGLRDAGIILDDKKAVVKERKYLWEKAPAKQGKVKIIVEEIV
jgi:Holliday junction resolvase RusA-like endonuclease